MKNRIILSALFLVVFVLQLFFPISAINNQIINIESGAKFKVAASTYPNWNNKNSFIVNASFPKLDDNGNVESFVKFKN